MPPGQIHTEKLNPLLIEWEEKHRRPVDSKAQHPEALGLHKTEFLFPLRRLPPQFEMRGWRRGK